MVDELYRIDGVHAFAHDHLTRTLAHMTTHPREVSVALVERRIGECWSPAGYCIVALFWSNEFGGDVAILDELFIARDQRGSGLGALVIAAVERACARAGAVTVVLEVEPGNTRALGLYERVGYSRSPRLHLRKELAPPLG